MSMSDLTDALLTSVVTYGPLALGLVLFLASLGLPLPSTLLVLAGGAFIQQGVLSWPGTVAVGLASVVLGDMLSYGVGRGLRGPIQARLGHTASWKQAERQFARRAPLAIYLTRCLLTQIALPINLIAGSSAYPFGRFASVVFAGELTWLLGYGSLGYAFGSQWEAISDLVSNFSGVLLGLLLLGAGGYALFRWQGGAATVAQVEAQDQGIQTPQTPTTEP